MGEWFLLLLVQYPLGSEVFGLSRPNLHLSSTTSHPTPISYSIARARAAMLSSISSEGRTSFSYVKQKSEESPKVSVNFINGEILFAQYTVGI